MSGTRVVVATELTQAICSLTGAAAIGPSTATTAGYSNQSFFTTIDRREVVVKAATNDRKRADLRREARLLQRLAALREIDLADSLPVPVVVAHGDHGPWTVNVFEAIAGDHGLGFAQPGARSLGSGARALARVLRVVHSLAPAPDPVPDSQMEHRASDAITALESLPDVALPGEVKERLIAASTAGAIRRGVAFVHGDFGLHNTLWAQPPSAPSLVGLLDWEFAGWGNPLLDVAWLRWSLALRGVPPSVFETFSDEYGEWVLRSLGATDRVLADLALAQMVQLLVRTEPGSAARSVWCERITELCQTPTR